MSLLIMLGKIFGGGRHGGPGRGPERENSISIAAIVAAQTNADVNVSPLIGPKSFQRTAVATATGSASVIKASRKVIAATAIGSMQVTRAASKRIAATAIGVPFAGTAYEYDYTDGNLPAAITWTRASAATYVNSSGTVTAASSGAARFTYDPFTLLPLGLLIERAYTNLTFASAIFPGTNGFAAAASVSANAAVAPDGATTADKLIEASDVNQFHYAARGDASAVIADSTDFLWSCWLKAGERTQVVHDISDKAGAAKDQTVNLSTHAAVNSDFEEVWLERYQNGWDRVSGRANSGTGASGLYARLILLNAAGSQQYNGDGASGLYVWGSDIGVGSYPTSHVLTTSGSADRVADTNAETRSLGSEFSILLRARTAQGPDSIAQILWEYDDGTANEVVYVYRDPSRQLHLVVVDGGVNQTDSVIGTVANDTDFDLAFRIKANDLAVSLNGAAVITDTSATIPTMTTIRRGHAIGGSNQWDGSIAYERGYVNALTDAQLMELTGASPVEGYTLPLTTSSQFTMTVNDESVTVYSYNNKHFAWFATDFPNTAEVSVSCGQTVTSRTLSPQRAAISTTAAGDSVTFSLTARKNLLLQINSLEPLFILADPLETSVPASSGAGIYNVVTGYSAPTDDTGNAATAINTAITDANTAGGGIVYVPAGEFRIAASLVLKSNVSLYLAPGAFLKIPAATSFTSSVVIHANTLTDAKIYGRGVIYGRGSSGANFAHTFHSHTCTRLKLYDVMFLDSYTTPIRIGGGDTDALLSGVKIVAGSTSLADGIDFTPGIGNISGTTVEDCFILSSDDSIAFLAGTNTFGWLKPGTASSITFQRNFIIRGIFTGASGSALDFVPYRSGSGSDGDQLPGGLSAMSSVTFTDSDIVYLGTNETNRFVFTFLPYGGSNIDTVTISDVRVEGAYQYGIWMYAQDCTSFGEVNCGKPVEVSGYIHNVTFQNVVFDQYGSTNNSFTGRTSTSNIDSITFDTVTMGGVAVTNTTTGHFTIVNSYVVQPFTYA